METIQTDKPKRKHNCELLRAKRAARALNIPWAHVTRERDRLRQNGLDMRGHEDEARQVAWGYWLARAGWNLRTQKPYWRNGFQRIFRNRIAAGADYDSIKFSDEVADTVRINCGEFSEWSTDDIWDFLLSDYPEREPIWPLYEQAICRLAAAKLRSSDELADPTIDLDLETPF